MKELAQGLQASQGHRQTLSLRLSFFQLCDSGRLGQGRSSHPLNSQGHGGGSPTAGGLCMAQLTQPAKGSQEGFWTLPHTGECQQPFPVRLSGNQPSSSA